METGNPLYLFLTNSSTLLFSIGTCVAVPALFQLSGTSLDMLFSGSANVSSPAAAVSRDELTLFYFSNHHDTRSAAQSTSCSHRSKQSSPKRLKFMVKLSKILRMWPNTCRNAARKRKAPRMFIRKHNNMTSARLS